jgi:transcriptional regulator GlxA family with amidase domain
VPLDALWGRRALTLREQLLEARTATERFAIIEILLLEMSRRKLSRHAAVRYAIEAFRSGRRAPSIAAVTERTGLSARRFIELFRREVGLTPKVFCRVARFRDVVNGIKGSSSVDWAQTALDCGYFDQAHFSHDFREFAGMSPSDYLRHRTGSPNHVRLVG